MVSSLFFGAYAGTAEKVVWTYHKSKPVKWMMYLKLKK